MFLGGVAGAAFGALVGTARDAHAHHKPGHGHGPAPTTTTLLPAGDLDIYRDTYGDTYGGA